MTERTTIPGIAVPGIAHAFLAWRGEGVWDWRSADGTQETVDVPELVRRLKRGVPVAVADEAVLDRLVDETRGTWMEKIAILARVRGAMPGGSLVVPVRRAVASKRPALEQADLDAQRASLGIGTIQGMLEEARKGAFSPAQAVQAGDIAALEERMGRESDPYWWMSAMEKAAAAWAAMRIADPGIRARATSDGTVTEATVVRSTPSRIVARCVRPPRARVGKAMVQVAGTGWPTLGGRTFRLAASSVSRAGFEIVLTGKDIQMAPGMKLTVMEDPFLPREGAPRSKWSRQSRSAGPSREVPGWL